MIYLDSNGVTVKAKVGAKGAVEGEVYLLNGEKYYVHPKCSSWEFGRNIKKEKSRYFFHSETHGKFQLNRVVTSKIISMTELFSNKEDFNEDIANWDTSRVKSMTSMFTNAKIFNQPIGNWDVGRVTSMMSMFAGAEKFDQPIGNWNTQNLNNMSYMFEYAKSFNQPIEDWNVSSVFYMSGAFANAESFNQSLKKWSLHKYAEIDGLFKNASSFNSELGSWSLRGSLNSLFDGAESFNQPLKQIDVSDVKRMAFMFSEAKSFDQDISAWDTSNVSSFESMFFEAESFNQNIGRWNVSDAKNMSSMFRGAKSFNQDISKWDVSNAYKMSGMFRDALAFNQNISAWQLHEKLKRPGTIFQNARSFNTEKFSPFNKIEQDAKVTTTTKAEKALGIELSSTDKKTISKIRKFLSARDVDQINLGLELMKSLNKTELYETFLFDCKITTEHKKDIDGSEEYSQELIQNKFFSGSGPAMPYLKYALLGLIINAPKEAKIHHSLRLQELTYFDSDILGVPELNFIIPLSEVPNLEIMTLRGFYKFHSEIDLNTIFEGNSLNHLTVTSGTGNLNWFQHLSKLKSLHFEYSNSDDILDHKNFKHLKNLESLTFEYDYFPEINFLSACKNLKFLKIISKIGDQANEVKNVDFLNGLDKLEELQFYNKYPNIDFAGFANCEKLKKLHIDNIGTIDLSFLNKCHNLELLSISNENSTQKIWGKINDINGLTSLPNLSSVLFKKASFFGFNNGLLMSNKSIKKTNNDRIKGVDAHYSSAGIKYNGVPFTGKIYNYFAKNESQVFNEYEVVKGKKQGYYKEYFSSGKIKLIAKYQDNILSKLVELNNEKNENIIQNVECVFPLNLESEKPHRIAGNSGGFLLDRLPYNGFVYFEINHKQEPRSHIWYHSRSYRDDSFFEHLDKLIEGQFVSIGYGSTSEKDLLFHENKLSVILEIKNGIISNFIHFSGSANYARVVVSDNYDFDQFPQDEEFKSAFLKAKKEIYHRLYLYLHPIKEVKMSIFTENKPNKNNEDINTFGLISHLENSSNSEDSSEENNTKPAITEKIEISKTEKKELSRIKKLLKTRDYLVIHEAVEELHEMRNKKLFEILLEGCHMLGQGHRRKLWRNNIFQGTAPAQPYLNFAVFSLIAKAPLDANIDDSIRKNNIRELIVTEFDLALREILKVTIDHPKLRLLRFDSFQGLQNLELSSDLDYLHHEVDTEGWFKGTKLKQLKIRISACLKFCKHLTALKYLKINVGYRYNEFDIKGLEYLKFLHDLEELEITNLELDRNILDYLSDSKKLKKITLSYSYSFKGNLNFDALKNFPLLQELTLRRINKSWDFEGLKSCKNLKSIDLDYVNNGPGKPFDFHLLCNSELLETISVDDNYHYSVNSQVNDVNFLKGLKNLKKLVINHKISIYHEDSIFLSD